MGSSDSDSKSYWNDRLISAVRKKRGKGKIITEEDILYEVEEALVEGADIDTTDCRNGNTALHTAVRKGFHEIVKILRQKGARSDIPNLEGETAITVAENLGCEEILSILQEPIPQKSESAVCESNEEGHLKLATDNQRIPRCHDREDVAREDYQSRDEDNSEVNSSCTQKTFNCETGTLVGFEYQWMQLAFTLQCAMQQKDSYFYLATEMVAAEKLDDVVIQYINKSGTRVGRFVQLKYSSNEKKTIRAQHLLATSGDFSVSKYFHAWLKVKRNPLFKRIESRHMILCTNMGLALRDLDKNGISYEEATDPDESFKLESRVKNTAWYKLLAKQECNKEIYSNLKASSDMYQLAMLLAERIDERKSQMLDLKIFQQYHVGLAKHIFNPKTKEFVKKFIDNEDLSPQCVKFREIFLSEYESRIRERKNNENNELPDATSNPIPESLVWDDVKERLKKLNFETAFGEPPAFVTNPQLTDVSELSDQFVKLLETQSKDNSHQRAINLGKAAKSIKVISDNIDKFSGHVLIKDKNKIKFSPQFLKNSQQSDNEGNIGEFKTEVQRRLGVGYDLTAFEFDVGKNKICTATELLAKDEMPEDDYIDDGEITQFFNEFYLAVNQPDFNELDEIVNRNMSAITKSLNIHNTELLDDALRSRLSRWFMKEGKNPGMEKEYLSYNVGEKILRCMRREVDSLMMSRVNLMYCERMKLDDIHFKKGIQSVITFLSEDGSEGSGRILEIVAPKNTLPTACRVYSTLKKIEKYEKMDGFFFTDVKTLLLSSTLNAVMETMKVTGYPDLLLVDCGPHNADEYSRELGHQLCGIVKRSVDKKIILITQEGKNSSMQLEIDYKTHRESENDYSFQHLTNDTQKKLLEKPVTKFQGHKTGVSFGKLLSIRDSSNVGQRDLSEIIDSGTLSELICKNELDICEKLESFDDKNFYIHRRIHRRVIIKNDILNDEKISDLFAISGASVVDIPQTLLDAPNVEILDSARDYQEQFEELCRRNNGENNIHWLKTDSGKYIWEKSEGDITHLLQYRDTTDNGTRATGSTKREDEITACDEPMIISDTAGMGKSMLLTHLAWKLKEKQPDMLVIKINLKQHITAIKEVQQEFSSDCDEEKAIEFLVEKLLRSETDWGKKISRRIIQEKGKVALLFDDFDEIVNPNNEAAILNLLGALVKHGIRNLFVATRPETKEVLELKLRTFSYEIEPFSRENQEEFLVKFWKSTEEFNDEEKANGRIEIYTEAILKKVADSINDRMNKFVGIPLHTKLVAEIFQTQSALLGTQYDTCEKFLRDDTGSPSLPEKINLIYLYEHFVKKKFDILFAPVCNREHPIVEDITDERYIAFINTHEKLALDAMFDKDQVEKLLISSRRDGNNRKVNDKIARRSGLITQFDDDKRREFGHQTYAEYFAARFLVDMLTSGKFNLPVRKIIEKNVLFENKYQNTRAFINYLLEAESGGGCSNEFWEFSSLHQPHCYHSTIFHTAVAESTEHILRFCLNHLDTNSENGKAVIDAKDRLGRPALVNAAATGQLWGVKLLVDKRANVNCTTIYGETPLLQAASAGQLDVVQYLVENRADVNYVNEYGDTPLVCAALAGKLDVMRYLVGNGADVNHANTEGVTPLLRAAEAGKLDVVQYLVENRADVNHANTEGVTPLLRAAEAGKLDVVRYLVRNGADVKHVIEHGDKLLLLAALAGQLDVVQSLVENRPDVKYVNKYGDTPLLRAASAGELDVVRDLVGTGADVNKVNKYGDTPLLRAASAGHLDVVQYLVENRADVNRANIKGVTPLLGAAEAGKLDVVQYLVENGGDVDRANTKGVTPLLGAAEARKLDVVQYLVENGGDVNQAVLREMIGRYSLQLKPILGRRRAEPNDSGESRGVDPSLPG